MPGKPSRRRRGLPLPPSWLSRALCVLGGVLWGFVLSLLADGELVANKLQWILSYVLIVVTFILSFVLWFIASCSTGLRKHGGDLVVVCRELLDKLDSKVHSLDELLAKLARHGTSIGRDQQRLEADDRGRVDNGPANPRGFSPDRRQGSQARRAGGLRPSQASNERPFTRERDTGERNAGAGSPGGRGKQGSSPSYDGERGPTARPSVGDGPPTRERWEAEGRTESFDAPASRAELDLGQVVQIWYDCYSEGRFTLAGIRLAVEQANPELLVIEGSELGLPDDLVVGIAHCTDTGEVLLLPTFHKPARAVQEWFDNQGAESLQGQLTELICPARVYWSKERWVELRERGVVA